MKSTKALVAASAMLTVLIAGSAVAVPDGIHEFVVNRLNNNVYPELTYPCAGRPDCDDGPGSATNPVLQRSYSVAGDDVYWDAWRIFAGTPLTGPPPTTTLTECGPWVAMYSPLTWNGDQTGTVEEVLAKFQGITARMRLDGRTLALLSDGPENYETMVDAVQPVGTTPHRQVVRNCNQLMTTLTSDCPRELVRDADEYCWGYTIAADISDLTEGVHTLVTTVNFPMGFPGICPSTLNTCRTDGFQTFEEDTACTVVFTRLINVAVPGGCR